MPTQSLQQRSRPDLEGVEALAREVLGAPRLLTPQVLHYLLAQHEVRGDEVVSWLRDRLGGLESYEHDLLLSPLFTPDFEARLGFEDLLGEGALDAACVEGLIESLKGRGLLLTLLHEGERIESPLPPVLAARYVNLLHLDADLPMDLLEAFRPLEREVRCHLRDRAWRRPQARQLLPVLLAAARRAGEDFIAYVRFVTDFVRSHRPASREECVTFLKNMAQAYEDDLQSHQRGERPFFDEELKTSYSSRRKVAQETVREHLDMISRARAVLAALTGG